MFGTKVKKKPICSYMFSNSSCFSTTDTPSACGGVVYCQYMPCDDQPLNFTGPFPDGHKPRITVNPFDRVFAGIAISPVDLDRVAADAFCHFRSEHLCHGSFFVVVASFFLEPCGFVEHVTCHFDLSRCLCEHPLDGLLLSNGFAEGLSLSCIIHCIFKCRLRQPQGNCTDTDPPAIQRCQRLL